MNIYIDYTKFKSINWYWYFRVFTKVKGFTLRILGLNITVTEKNATEKLIETWKKRNAVAKN